MDWPADDVWMSGPKSVQFWLIPTNEWKSGTKSKNGFPNIKTNVYSIEDESQQYINHLEVNHIITEVSIVL